LKNEIFVLGAPRTGFTLLLSIINELSAYRNTALDKSNLQLNRLVDIASIYLKNEFTHFFKDKIDMKDYMYNGEFDLLVGGPKWINPEDKEECVIRKYIGIKDNGDFTFLLYLPKNLLEYDKVVHSHYFPQSWVEDSYYDSYLKLVSIRNPMGVINSAVFSINAITSEYITKYVKDFDENEFREIMALYKLTDLEMFDGLVRFLRDYLESFVPIIEKYNVVKWEDIINSPIETIAQIGKLIDIDVNEDEINNIWDKLDHKNLPKHHLFNFRKGHGIVGEWKKRLTNHHLKIFEKYNFNNYLRKLGYEEIKYFNEKEYTDFQREVDLHINKGQICNKISDDNLFKFCWNKSNIAVTSHEFDRFQRDGDSQVERSSLKDNRVAVEFSEFIKPKVELINKMLRDFETNPSFEIENYYSLFSRNLEKTKVQEMNMKMEALENMKKLELKLIETNQFSEVLKKLKHFNVVSNNKHAQELKEEFKEKLNLSSPNIIITEEDPTEILQNYLNKHSGVVVAKIGKKYFKKQSLFLISIPKSGTHLLFELAKAFGYREGGVCPSNPKEGYWYYTEYSNSHTNAKHFFNTKVYKSDFGNRDHPFLQNPALFIYRNPLDIVASEANYYHKSTKTAFSGYLSGLTYSQRLTKLINDKWLLGSIRDRVSQFIAWTYFDNVISLSFEELIGDLGGGNNNIQKQLVWSIQLKLQVPGKPTAFASQVFNKNSDTFFKGQIGGYKEHFKEEHYERFKALENDFMQELGYDINSKSRFSSRIGEFKNKRLQYDDNLLFPPVLMKSDYLDYNIVKYRNQVYGIPRSLGTIDLENDELDKSIIVSDKIDLVKIKIQKEFLND